ncbi:MAG: DUF5658 family protein [Gemmataceae bacterium]|nr:DUF5658 family protein [Gemmataceae bacterium]
MSCPARRSLRLPGLSRSGTGGLGPLAVAFVVLTLLDLLLTAILLRTPGECFYEANPLADWILREGGWLGMSLYKLACAGMVLAVVGLLAHRHARAARRVLLVGCPLLAVVVGYSVYLLSANWAEWQQLHQAQAQSEQLEASFEGQRAYKQKVRALAEVMAAGRLSLDAAVRALNDSLSSLGHDPMPVLQALFPDFDDNEKACLAIALVREVGFVLEDRGAVPEPPLPRLQAEFASTFGQSLPPLALTTFVPSRHTQRSAS